MEIFAKFLLFSIVFLDPGVHPDVMISLFAERITLTYTGSNLIPDTSCIVPGA